MKKFFENTRKPQKGLGGSIMLQIMNTGHNPMALWALSHLKITESAVVLDAGCGGGKNIANLLGRITNGKVYGVDYSPASVEKAKKHNKKALALGKAEILQASVSSLPFSNETFDIVTAFETVYFWPDLINDFKEVKRVLNKGGRFLICNEMAIPEKSKMWIDMLDLNVYTKEELTSALSQAGFASIDAYNHKNGRWLCVIAESELSV